MAMQLGRSAIVCLLGALAGCELLANIPAYTNANGDGGTDGGDGGSIDGTPECVTSAMCTAPEVCVMGTCQPCDSDAHCGPAAENVCLPEGVCAPTNRIAYASPTGTNATCSQVAPCSIEQAFMNAAADPAIDIVKLAPGNYPRTTQIAIAGDTVILAAEGATLTAAQAVAMFRVTTGALTIVGGEMVGNQQFNALCFGMAGQLGTLKLHRVVTRGGAYGVGGFSCNISVVRTMVMQNTGVGVYVNGGTARITNSVVMANGAAGSGEGGVQMLQVTDVRVDQSTIIGNTSENDLYAGGLTCTGSTNVVSTSISWGNVGTAKGPLDAECNVDYSVVEPAYPGGGAHLVRMDPLFQALGNFHLQPTSPARGAGDPAQTTGVDFDNEVRPQGGGAFDCGADEIQ